MTNQNRPPTTIPSDFLLMAYGSGYFPMADPKSGEIGWYSPDPRTIFDLDDFHIPRSLQLTLKKNPFAVRINHAFGEVIKGCAARGETWISPGIIKSYTALHRLGFAHSVECWQETRLVGGLYGVAVGGAFFGESMFSRQRDASKVALVHLVQRLKERHFTLLDTQFTTPHLARFGAKEITKQEYLERLAVALKVQTSFL